MTSFQAGTSKTGNSLTGLVLAAPASGAGKTVVALGLMRAFSQAGLHVQPFKSGPDYIDPAFHSLATGRPSYNLDLWAMDGALLDSICARGQDADICLTEGAMGLFDGGAKAGQSGTGSGAEIAARMGWPVLLVLDIAKQAQSAGATALGFARFARALPFAGVILNRVASPRHERLARQGLEQAGLPVFGAIARDAALALPERHLGLVQAGEQANLDRWLTRCAAIVRDGCDLEGIHKAARGKAQASPSPTTASSAPPISPPAQRIALANDAAFSFIYPHLLDGWRAAGAQILPFSPLNDEPPDPDADLVWLPGGYPELHAGRIAGADSFLSGLRRHAETRPVHGECGGYMVLGRALIDKDGATHGMAGLLGLVTSFKARKLHLGYRRAKLAGAMPGHAAGAFLRGHEFHYAGIVEQPDAPLASITDAEDRPVQETGSRRGNVTGTFFHVIARESA